MRARIGVTSHKHLVRSQLGGTIQVDRAAGLIRGQGHYTLHTLVNTGVNQVHGTMHVGLDALKRVVLRRRNNLGSSSMHHVIHAIQRTVQTLLVAHVADEEAHTRIVLIVLGHVPLLHLITRKDDDLARVVFLQRHRHKRITKRACTTGDQDYGVF